MDFINTQIKMLAEKYAQFGITERDIREMTQQAADGDNIPFKRALFGARATLSEVFNQPDETSYEEIAEFPDITAEQAKEIASGASGERVREILSNSQNTPRTFDKYLQ